MGLIAKQDVDEEQTHNPDVRETLQNPTDSATGHGSNDAGAMSGSKRDGLETRASPSESDLEKQKDTKSCDNSRESSNPPSRPPSQHLEDEYNIVSFPRGDPENPYNWSNGKKTYVLLTCIALVMNSTTGSALSSGATKETSEYFGVTNQSLLVLPVSIYLIGYVLGPLV